MQQHTTARGLVIRETDFGDADRYITVLTDEGAKIEVLCRGIRRRGSRMGAAVRLFCYSELTLYESRGRFTLNDVALLTSFWGVTQDIEGYALACYFVELAALIAETDELCPALTRLVLYALHALTGGKRPFPLIKAAFELRIFADAGFAPQLGACGACGGTLEEGALFSVREGVAACPGCARRLGGDWAALAPGTLAAMRHIILCELKRVFSFALGAQSLAQLADLCERYALTNAGRGFDSLTLYHTLLAPAEQVKHTRSTQPQEK